MNESGGDERAVPEIAVERLQELLAAGGELTVFDVRTEAERAEWAIAGSLHRDIYDSLKEGRFDALDDIDLPRDRPVVTVCGAGITSRIAARELAARGYSTLSLQGGMKAWSLAWNEAELQTAQGATVLQLRRTGKGCLSYIVGSHGEAAVIDPSLPADVYLREARARGWRIRHVLDTHVHADHLSRARALADAAGGTVHLFAQDRVRFPFSPLREGEELPIGRAVLTVVHTPGHTLESTSYLLDGQVLFTGDTLFLDGVGRPDLEASPEEARKRAHLLHRSLHRLLRMAPGLLVLPGHTSRPVAFDGRPLVATLEEISGRVSLLQAAEEDFVEALLGRIPPTPPNHHAIVAANETGETPALDPVDLEAGANRCAVS